MKLPPFEDFLRDAVRDTRARLTLILATWITLVIHFAMAMFVGVDVFGFCWFFLVPVGSILLGLIPGIAYYRASIRTSARPKIWIPLSMLAIGISWAVAVQVIPYLQSQRPNGPGGARVTNPMSFSHYLDFALRTKTVGGVLESAPIFKMMGRWGYLFAVLQVLGFVAGTIVAWAKLRRRPYCVNCRSLLRTVSRCDRYVLGPGALESVLLSFHQQEVEAWAGILDQLESHVPKEGCDAGIRLHTLECPRCNLHRHRLESMTRQGTRWKSMLISEKPLVGILS